MSVGKRAVGKMAGYRGRKEIKYGLRIITMCYVYG